MKLALLIEYDGTEFSGWQIQPGQRSVQGELEAALARITRSKVDVHGSGRTDTGVHATGMVAHITLPESFGLPLNKLLLGINGLTGRDVVVHEARQVPENFNARFSANARQYCYTIKQGRVALGRQHMWAINHELELGEMVSAAALLLGEHDFTSFSKMTVDVKHFRCVIESARWIKRGDMLYFTIKANRFVRGMVRALVGAMVAIGEGKLELAKFESLLHQPQELERGRYISPPRGLVLEGIEYPAEFGLWPIQQKNFTGSNND